MRPGGYSTHVPVPNCKYVIKVPVQVSMTTAAMLSCSVLTPFAAFLKAKPYLQLQEKKYSFANLLLIGAGGLGIWGIMLAKVMFKDINVKIFVADVSQDHLELAKESGADEIVMWNRGDDVNTMASKVTHGGVDNMGAVVDFFGSNITVGTGIETLHKAGTLVIVGLAGGKLKLDIGIFVRKSCSLQSQHTGTRDEIRKLVDLLVAHEIDYPGLEYCTLDEINEVYDKLKEGKIKSRMMIKLY